MKRFSKFITEAETEYQKWLKDYESSKEYKVVTGLKAKGIEPMRIGLPGQEFIPITNALKQSNGDVKKAIDLLVKRVVDDEKQRPKSRRMHPNLKLEAVTSQEVDEGVADITAAVLLLPPVVKKALLAAVVGGYAVSYALDRLYGLELQIRKDALKVGEWLKSKAKKDGVEAAKTALQAKPSLKKESASQAKTPLNSNEGRLRLFSNAFVHFKARIQSEIGGDSKKPIYCVYSYNKQGSENWRGSSGSHDVTVFVEHPTEADKMVVFNRIYHWSSSRAWWNTMKVETLPKAEARTLWTTLSNQQIVGSRLDVAQIRYANGQATVISKSTKI